MAKLYKEPKLILKEQNSTLWSDKDYITLERILEMETSIGEFKQVCQRKKNIEKLKQVCCKKNP